MTDVIEEMQAECAQDIWRAKRRAEALAIAGDAARAIGALGYRIEVTAPGGMLELRFDPDQAIAPAEGPLEEGGAATGGTPAPVDVSTMDDPGRVLLSQGDVAAEAGAPDDAPADWSPVDRGDPGPPPDPDPGPDAAPDPVPDPAPDSHAVPEFSSGRMPGAQDGPATQATGERRQTRAATAAGKTPPWTEGDREAALDMLARGKRASDVAEKLGRPYKQIANLSYKGGAAEIARRRAALEKPATDPAPGPAPPADAPAPLPDTYAPAPELPEGLTAAERAIWRHLDGLPGEDFWTPARDLQLAEGLARGDGSAAVAEDLDVDSVDVGRRWVQLNTRRGDLYHQQALLRVLRWRAEGS